MDDTAPSLRSQTASTVGLGDTFPTASHRIAAFATCATLVASCALAAHFGVRQGPEIRPFVPIAATVWSLADLLTAFLLLAQFYVNGRPPFAVLTVAYALSGFLTWPYLIAFPGIFLSPPLTLGAQQISLVLWLTWHCSFPALVILSLAGDGEFKRIVSRSRIRVVAVAITLLPIAGAAVATVIIVARRDALPHLIVAGHFQALFRYAFLPPMVALNVVACLTILARRKRLTTLRLWLCVAMFSACLDSILNLCGTRYSYAWDVGKLITVFTASVVLVVILCEIVGLYGRLALVARIDALTSLPNRRAFEEHFELVYHNARRQHAEMALLMVDIDFFKRYNDSYGHSSGDECLRAVAARLARTATRPLDLIARYGGEEFVVVLPDTPLHGVLIVAERIREAVEALVISDASQPVGRVTVSVGAGFTPNAVNSTASELFEAADSGLYEAKEAGRNRVTLGSTQASVADAPASGARAGSHGSASEPLPVR